jgi:hypothetical protein
MSTSRCYWCLRVNALTTGTHCNTNLLTNMTGGSHPPQPPYTRVPPTPPDTRVLPTPLDKRVTPTPTPPDTWVPPTPPPPYRWVPPAPPLNMWVGHRTSGSHTDLACGSRVMTRARKIDGKMHSQPNLNSVGPTPTWHAGPVAWQGLGK